MALSNGRGNANSGPLVFLSPRAKQKDEKTGKSVDLEKPIFEVSRINAEGKIEKTAETYSEVRGDLVGLVVKDRVFKDEVTKETVLYIRDNTPGVEKPETYHIGLPSRIPTRSLQNSLLSLESPKDITVSYYRSKKGYDTFFLGQGDGPDNGVSWKHELKDLPQADVIKDKKGAVVKTDYSDVDAFFEKELKALADRLGIAKKETAAAPAAQTAAPAKTAGKPTATKASVSEQVLDEDVPF